MRTRRLVVLAFAAIGLLLVSLTWLDDSGPGDPVPVAAPRPADHPQRVDASPMPGPMADPLDADVQPLAVASTHGATLTLPAPTTQREGSQVVSLSGRVVDPSGSPVAGAELRFGQHGNDRRILQHAWSNPIEASHRRTPGSGVISDADGRFTLFLDAAHYRAQYRSHGWLVVLATGHATLVHRTPELRSDTIDLGELQLALGTELTARTVDSTGRPLPDVTVEFESLLPTRTEDVRSGVRLEPHVDEQRFAEVLEAVLVATSDSLGRIQIAFLPEGTGRLRFARDDLRSVVVSTDDLAHPGPFEVGDVTLDPGGSISGTLVDTKGQPVVGGYAAVILRDDGAGRDAEAVRQATYRSERDNTGELLVVGRTRGRATTDDQGHFAIMGLTEGWFELSATAEHHAWTHRAGVAAGSSDLELVLPLPGTLQLDITDVLTGAPILEPTIYVSHPESYAHLRGGTRWTFDVSSDPSLPGLFTVGGVGTSGARLGVSAAGYGTLNTTEGPVAPGTVVTRELRLVPGLALAGVVIDENDEPLADVRVRMIPAVGRRTPDSLSDEQGRFEFSDLAPGQYEIEADRPGLLASPRQPLDLIASRTEFVVRLYREATLAGRVLDRHSRPTPGITVLAWPLWPLPAFERLPPDPQVDLRSSVQAQVPVTVSDESGHYGLAHLLPGTYAVFTTHDTNLRDDLRRTRRNAGSFDVPDHAQRVVMKGGGEVVQDLTLATTTSLFGSVHEDEHPAADANIKVYVPAEGFPSWRLAASTQSDEAGKYDLPNLEPGRSVVVVQARSGSFPVTRMFELDADAEQRHDVTTGGGVVRGIVVEAGSGVPQPGVLVIANPDISAGAAWSEATGLTLDELQRVQASPSACRVRTTTNAEGRFELRDLPPGQVSAQTQGGGTLPSWSAWIRLDEGETLELTLEVVRGGRIECTLRFRSGDPVDPNAVYVELRDPAQDRLIQYGNLNDGHFVFDALESGRYEVRVNNSDDESMLLRETVSVTRGATEHLELLLDD